MMSGFHRRLSAIVSLLSEEGLLFGLKKGASKDNKAVLEN